MLRKILSMVLSVVLVLTFVVPAYAAEEEELPLEVTLQVHSNRIDHFEMDGLYLDNVLYIHPYTVCELTGAFIHEDTGDSITFSLHNQGRLITVTPENGGRLQENITMGRSRSYSSNIPAVYYDGSIYTSATHLLRYMGAVVGFGEDENSDNHMTVHMPYTTMDLVSDFAEADGYRFSWAEAEGTFLQPEDVIALAALDTALLSYDSNFISYAWFGHADKVATDIYVDILKEILRTEGAELTETGYSEVDFYGDASNVTGFSATWIKEVLGWAEAPELLSKVNSSMSGLLDSAGLLLNVGGDYLKTLDTAIQFANMSTHQQELLDMTLNTLPEGNRFYQQKPELFKASAKVSQMFSSEYNANKAAAWNSVYSLLINAGTSVVNNFNPFSLAWDTMTSVVKVDPLISDLINDEKYITFAAGCCDIQTIAWDLLSYDTNELWAMTYYIGGNQDQSVNLQEYQRMDMILALKAALTARCLLMQTGWLTEAAQNSMEYQALWTAQLLQKAQNAKPVRFDGIENRDEDLTWIENLAKYKIAYAKLLREELQNKSIYDDLAFQLVYINDDKTPELAFFDGWFHAAGVYLYTYYEGEVVEMGCFGEYGVMTYAPKQNLIVSFHGGQGLFATGYYRWIDNDLETVCRIETWTIWGDDADDYTTTYYVDDQEVTAETYLSAKEKAEEGYTFENISIGKSKELTEENIQDMIKNTDDFIALG